MKKIVARLSEKHRKVGVGKDDVAENEIKKEARSEAGAAWPVNSLPPKPNITYIEVHLYAKAHRIHLKVHTQRMRSHPRNHWKESAKATSHLRRIQERSASKVCCSARKAVRYANSYKRTRR